MAVAALYWTLWASLLFAGADEAGAVHAHESPIYQPVPLAVAPGAPTRIPLSGAAQGRNYLLLVGSLSAGDQPVRLTANDCSADAIDPLAVAAREVDARWLEAARGRRSRMLARRTLNDRPAEHHAAARFAEERGFYLFVEDRDFLDADNYREIRARLVAVGKHCLVYVDVEDGPETCSRATIDEIVATFDEDVLPRARRVFGRHKDVDRDGKFTILLTHWLGKLSGGKVSVGGFVRGGDFFTDVAPPFSNQCDMMYLNSNLRPGRHLRTLIAHEYTHAITFSEHAFGDYLPGRGGDDEESWLSEATAHLAENLAGIGWSNLDYRVSTFLTAPHRYRLVVRDYYRAGLWRCHGSRGSTYLFLRWCVDRYGEELLKDLTQSNLAGIENLETATLTPFEDLFRGWTVALALDGLCPKADEAHGLVHLDLRGRLESRLLAGPRIEEIRDEGKTLTLAPTSSQAFFVHAPPGEARQVVVESPADARLQLTLVRLPDDYARVELDVASPDSASDYRVALSQLGGAPVRWEHLTWERATLPQSKESENPPQVEILRAEELFPRPQTAAGEAILSERIDLAELAGRDVVVKAIGRDLEGRRVAAQKILVIPALPAAGLAGP